MKRLPSNFLVNNLLSIRGDGQSNASSSPPCEKHDGEILNLFCKSCDQLICRDCAVNDHRDHKYDFIKEIFPIMKRKILKIIQKSRENIHALESSVEAIKELEDNMHKNSMEVNGKIDNFIDKLIKLLEWQRKSLKDDLKNLGTDQKQILDAQTESFVSSLGRLKSSVQFAEEALSRGNEVEILSAKYQMVDQLTELNSATSKLKPRGQICYDLKPTDLPVAKIANVTEYDKEYELRGMPPAEESFCGCSNRFFIRRKSKISTLDQNNKVQVTIVAPDSKEVPVPVSHDPDGSFSFSYKPDRSGVYKVEVLINRRYVYGSPFTWKVYNESLVDKFLKKLLS